MTLRHLAAMTLTTSLAFGVAIAVPAAAGQDAAVAPLSVQTARVSIAGTSNIHDWTATSSTVRLTRVQLGAAPSGTGFWDAVVRPGAIEAFEIAIPAATLTSPRSGLDKNMHKALKATAHADITFKLLRLSPKATTPGEFTAVGTLRIAGVEREVSLDLKVGRVGQTLKVKGATDVLMTDFGIDPPKALLGTVRTDPKVSISFETVLASPLT